MRAMESLRREHSVILYVARRMHEVVSGTPDEATWRPFLKAVLDFLRTFADSNHHGKEEGALFAFMRAHPDLVDVAERLDDQHVTGRRLVNRLELAFAGAFDGGACRRAVLDYVDFIRDHITLEDEMIFETVECRLSADDDARLASEFDAVEAGVLGAGTLNRMLEQLDAAAQMSARG